MVEKLKLVREQIPWSLVAKGAVFATAWLSLPYLLFLIVAAFLFFSPPFQAVRFLPIFLFLSWLSYISYPGPREAVFLGILFLVALGVKNLVFIDRILAAQVFLTTASFLLWLAVFTVSPHPGFSFFSSSLLIIFLLFFLLRFMFQLGQPERLAPTPLLLMVLMSFLSLQLAWVLVLLPAEPVFQALSLAILTGFFTEFLFGYLNRSLNEKRTHVLFYGVCLTLLALILSLPFSLTP
ncbi:MAG: hypothetical protein AAB903_00870 [Patescibacteria group bacterium]